MKYCTHCGAQVSDDATVCMNCGCMVGHSTKTSETKVLGTIARVLMILADVTYAVVAVAFLVVAIIAFSTPAILDSIIEISEDSSFFLDAGPAILGIVFLGMSLGCLIPLAWCIPLTINVKRKLASQEPISITVKICTLLLINIVAGVLLLCIPDKS